MNERLDGFKKLVTSRIFVIVVAVIVVLYIVFFPHTKTTTVNAELTGVFATQQERYLLHNRVEFKTDFVCVPGATIKSQSIHYKLNGSIKSIETVNCDGTYGVNKYNANGTFSYQEVTAFVGGVVQLTTRDYTKDGQLEVQKVDVSGTLTETVNTYFDSKGLEKTTVTTTAFGEKVGENVTDYDEDGNKTLETVQTWANGEIELDNKIEYTNGNLSKIEYSDDEDGITAVITCDSNGTCILQSLSAEKYDVDYNDTSQDYDMLVDGEASSQKVVFTPITQWNYLTVFAEIEQKAQAVLDAQ